MTTPTISDVPGACGRIQITSEILKAKAKAKAAKRERIRKLWERAQDLDSPVCTGVMLTVLLILIASVMMLAQEML